MKNFFIVAAQNLSKEQEKVLIAYLGQNGCGWWHWIENYWLIVDPRQILTTEIIRDEISRISNNQSRSLVLEVQANSNWNGYGPNSPERNMGKWLDENWQ